jgi:hypothetical protein
MDEPMIDDQPAREWQSDSYSQARDNFLKACAEAGAAVDSYINPRPGPAGEELATDVALFGTRGATRLVVMVSGVHGVEGFSGSATQVGWISQRRYEYLPDDTAVLMVHLINPWGAAYLRRYTEDNVDLCRNFLDFTRPLPVNEAYTTIRSQLVPGSQMGEHGEFAGRFLGQLVARRGLEYVVDLFMAGQYEDPDGFGYGGQQPTWANRTLREILVAHNDSAERVGIIEFHTGLGPWAYGQIITLQMGEDLDRVRDWFGPWVFNPSADRSPGEEGYRVVHGHTIEAYRGSFPDAQITAATLEFGTYPPDATLALLLQEHLLVRQPGGGRGVELTKVKERLLEYHHPADWEWRCAMWTRSLQVIRQAIHGLNTQSRGTPPCTMN